MATGSECTSELFSIRSPADHTQILLLNMSLHTLPLPYLEKKTGINTFTTQIPCKLKEREEGPKTRELGKEGGEGGKCRFRCRVEGVKNLGSYHPVNKIYVIWNSESESGSETLRQPR